MDPFTIALATFGVQKLRGKSTRMALKDAALVGGTAFGVGQLSQAGAFGAQAQAGQGIMGAIGRGGPFSSIGSMLGIGASGAPASQTGIQALNMPPSEIIKQQATNQATKATGQNILQQAGTALKEGYGKLGTAEKIGLGTAGITLLGSDEENPEMPKGTRPEDYEAARKAAKEQLAGGFEAAEYEDSPAQNVYDYDDSEIYTFNQGGIVNALPKYNQGGINYLPSKTDHDEKDVNNYIRATGYVEDGSGNGDKDEDTMLAQLADGEFVSRADAILGAGIMEGASPKDMKAMRRKGAAFFYDQQAKFKRVYDLLNASRKDN